MHVRLQDKVVVITGAGHGLGRDASRLFAAEGAKVVATDIVDTHVKSVADEIRAAGGEAAYAQADVTSQDDMEAAVQIAVDTFGRLDVMYCNAGIPEVGFGTVSFVDTTLENFEKVVGGEPHRRVPRRAGGGAAVRPPGRGRQHRGDDLGRRPRRLPGVPELRGGEVGRERPRARRSPSISVSTVSA